MMETGNSNAAETSKKLPQTELNTCNWIEKSKLRNLKRDLYTVSGRLRNSIPAHTGKK
jgi:hypothetical protein